MNKLFNQIDALLLENNDTGNNDFESSKKAFSDEETEPSKESTPYEDKMEEMFIRTMNKVDPSLMSEATYKDFTNDPTKNDRQTINIKIKEINSDLISMERALKHCLKLKSNSKQDVFYWKGTFDKFTKIEKRLLTISKQLRQMK